jgi:predicted O-methyltransferase YrrM
LKLFLKKSNMIKNKIDALIRKFFIHKNEELPSFLLQKLFHQGAYLPFTTSSLKFRLLACLANDIVVNNRKAILEFGSGISTILTARLIKLNKLDTTITSIDENDEWQELIKSILEEEELINYVTFVHAPTEISTNLNQSYEYNSKNVIEKIKDSKFDLILVDGPSAWQSSTKMSRASNSQFIVNNLANNYTIFIDNSDRPGEVALTKKLATDLNLNPVQLDPTFIAFVKGQHFNFII